VVVSDFSECPKTSIPDVFRGSIQLAELIDEKDDVLTPASKKAEEVS